MTLLGIRGLVLALATAAVLVGAPTVAVAPTAYAAPASARAVATMIAKTNEARQAAGCAPVEVDEGLRAVAQEHASELARDQRMDHDNSEGESAGDRIGRAGYESSYGENLAYGYRDPAEVVRLWMGTAVHRENIENCDFTAVGVGYDPNGDYWVQDFGG